MASLPNRNIVTYEEWLRLPETKGEEVVNGEIRSMTWPTWNHARIVDTLGDLVRRRVDQRSTIVASSGFDLIIRRQPLTARVPDIAVFQSTTIVERDGRIFSAPQLIAEVRSPSNTRREMSEKLADYASLGVPEVWLLSYEPRTVEVLYLEDGRFIRHALLTEGFLKPKCFPNVEVPISEIWPA